MNKILVCFSFILTLFCNMKQPKSTANLLALGNSNFNNDGPLIIPLLGEVDSNVTTNCGAVTNSSSDSKDNKASTNSVKSIHSVLTFKTRETLSLKFQYNSSLTKGNIDTSQGFVFSSGALIKNSVTGQQGTIDWSKGSVYITNNLVSVLEVDVNLIGSAKEGATSISSKTCNTSDGTNCTSSNTNGRTCLTTDNKVCLVSSSDGKEVIIRGKISCYISS